MTTSASLPYTCKIETERDGADSTAVREAQIEPRCDVANFIAYESSYGRRLGIVEHDARFIIQHARAKVSLCRNRVDAKRCDAIDEPAVRGVERLALPANEIRPRRKERVQQHSGQHERDAPCRTVGNHPCRARRIEIDEPLPAHRKEAAVVYAGAPSFTAVRNIVRSSAESGCLCTETACCAAASTTSSSLSAKIAIVQFISLGYSRQSMNLRAMTSSLRTGRAGPRAFISTRMHSRPPTCLG